MTITITISTENAAFENQAGLEVSRILTKLAAQVETWPGVNVFTIGLRDVNGNKVGECVAESNRKRTTTPERSECVRCGDPLEGGAKTLCRQCQEESTPEIENIYEREFEEEHD